MGNEGLGVWGLIMLGLALGEREKGMTSYVLFQIGMKGM